MRGFGLTNAGSGGEVTSIDQGAESLKRCVVAENCLEQVSRYSHAYCRKGFGAPTVGQRRPP